MSRVRRIHKELEDVKKDKEAGIILELVSENDLSHLKGKFIGPRDTPYEGGLFIVDIQIPPEYPFKPPLMKFDTKIYHPNISSVTGAICLDILKSDSGNSSSGGGHGAWTPILTLKSSLISLQSLLQSPEPNDPQDAQVASVFLKDRNEFEETARYWTKIYAPNKDNILLGTIELKTVQLFEDMGFNKFKIVEVLKKLKIDKVYSGDEETKIKVIEELLK
ncbi:hypothetical protein PACTADRAFT_68915 [Pachysolen tannophilus NRRL Y-2460]|uniref:Ubiquitin-conjugating enzyme E2 1 n=1 Tax=Pachysolen tannophilus NRRL Y-2460 TaxID=669874 RepID=A0A1E4TUT1_PACTA|nr:hypothetical protein PACTADRAFT_68915 [Pachysolen tannophilus NRRL Y-2460]